MLFQDIQLNSAIRLIDSLFNWANLEVSPVNKKKIL
jgi:hypothetical protein